MRNFRQLKMVKRMRVTMQRLGRFKDWVEPRFYREGAIDQLTGRRQGPSIDLYTPRQRQKEGIPAGLTNAQYRASVRRIMTHYGLPPVGHLSELTQEEHNRFFDIRDERDKLDLPFSGLKFTPDQIKQCAEWHEKVERGEMTRAEYHRLARELIGMPPEEATSSGQAVESAEVLSSSGG